LTSLLYTKLTHARRQLEQIRRQTSPLSLLEPHFQRLDELSSSLQQCVQGRLREKRLELLALQKQALALRPDIQVATLKTRLERLVSHLESINPRNLLKKGYCILFQENSPSVILSIRDLKKEDRLRLNLSDGEAHVTVNEIVP
jgi:exodeoxyribonuclease VII large subunit